VPELGGMIVSRGQGRREVRTDAAPKPVFSYSQGIISNGLLFVSGQGPTDRITKAIPEDFGDQVRATLDNVAAIAEAAGGRLSDAVRVGVYLANLDNFEEMDAAYRDYFEEPLPARTTVGVSLRGIAVEIDAVIAIPDEQ
jgi:2-iminobutanoate/2-iminopropanoate deaminase